MYLVSELCTRKMLTEMYEKVMTSLSSSSFLINIQNVLSNSVYLSKTDVVMSSALKTRRRETIGVLQINKIIMYDDFNSVMVW